MGTVDDDQRVQLDITNVKARADRDMDGRPTLIISDGSTEVELSGGAHHAEAAGGARQITDAIWVFIQDATTQRLAAARAAKAGDLP